MKFSESWLRTLCNPPIASAVLQESLTMAGLEVEAAEPAAPAFSDVVVARIDRVEPHPSADRLRVCHVDAGTEKVDWAADTPRKIMARRMVSKTAPTL